MSTGSISIPCSCGECLACTARASEERRREEVRDATITECQTRLRAMASAFLEPQGNALVSEISGRMARNFIDAAEALDTLRKPCP